MWSRGAFHGFLASVGRGFGTLLLAEVRQHDTNLVRHLRNVVPLSAPTLLTSACTNREQQALLHVCLFEETATVVELELWRRSVALSKASVDSRLHLHRDEDGAAFPNKPCTSPGNVQHATLSRSTSSRTICAGFLPRTPSHTTDFQEHRHHQHHSTIGGLAQSDVEVGETCVNNLLVVEMVTQTAKRDTCA